jgi:Spy/CpxP family protein refolding chaperone
MGLVITTALLLVGTPVMAQQHPMGAQSPMPMRGMGAGMALAAFQPARLLDQRDSLELTAEQVTRLKAIQADAQKAHDEAMARHDEHQSELMESLQADSPDLEAIQTHFMAAHAAMGLAHWAEMDAGLKARAVLTDAQRAKVKVSMPGGGMQHRHGQGGPRMR